MTTSEAKYDAKPAMILVGSDKAGGGKRRFAVPTLSALQDIGFIEAARKDQVSLGVFHLGPSISS